VTYADNKTTESVVVVNDASNEARLPLSGTVRSIEANADGAAVAIIEKK
jgi:hypothetical protein